MWIYDLTHSLFKAILGWVITLIVVGLSTGLLVAQAPRYSRDIRAEYIYDVRRDMIIYDVRREMARRDSRRDEKAHARPSPRAAACHAPPPAPLRVTPLSRYVSQGIFAPLSDKLQNTMLDERCPALNTTM